MLRFATRIGLGTAAVAGVLALGFTAQTVAQTRVPAKAGDKADPLSPGKVKVKTEVDETKNDAWKVTVAVNSPTATYAVNDEVVITVTSEEAGYLYVINANEQGEIFCLFPNEFQSNNAIQAGVPVVIPAPDNPKKFRFRADRAGREIIKAIVTKEPLATADPKDLSTRAVTKFDKTKYVRLVTEAMGGDPTKVKPEEPTPPTPPTPPPGGQKPEVIVQKQKIEQEKPDVYKKKKKEWSTGEVIITITGSKPDQVKPPVDPQKPPVDPQKPPVVDPNKPKPPVDPQKPPVVDQTKPDQKPDQVKPKPPVDPQKPPVDPQKPPVNPDKPKPPADPQKP